MSNAPQGDASLQVFVKEFSDMLDEHESLAWELLCQTPDGPISGVSEHGVGFTIHPDPVATRAHDSEKAAKRICRDELCVILQGNRSKVIQLCRERRVSDAPIAALPLTSDPPDKSKLEATRCSLIHPPLPNGLAEVAMSA